MLLEDLQVVLKVAEFKGITAAAKSLNMQTATASAAIKRVEKALGKDLFVRTTRQLRLSSAGERYIPQCQQALLTLEQAKKNMRDDLDVIDGELRIASSSDFGRNLAAVWLDEFLEAHPKVNLKLSISDSNIDLYRDSIDIALRYGSPSDSNLYGFKICNVPRLLCASPEYLEKNGTPKHPNDLVDHNGLFYQLRDVVNNSWRFTRDGEEFKVRMLGNRASNDGDLVRRWCVSGKGLAFKSCLDISEDLLSGRLVKVMPEYKTSMTELWLVCPSKQSITPAVRLLRDVFKEKCSAILMGLVDEGILSKDMIESE
ncbi:LysR substrate-binding domain-containing protein [Pseudocolwellia sp. AS88]|uniref:LysR family transcriptional regulator n=1 Tax=Pseudocolwellia sp. AS88 TaxID=3063958 RepID=UPI0026EB496F|nr:LysR family transcriptional regulator [Pseudocolwellia sp. AS88]MDO7084265.1 LysR substrate-binding domain-containing protein [Pseudocolwellia sp. AS88]